jgi:hypothetical protein
MIDRTVWFQSIVSPVPTTPSGQKPGVVSTAQTLIFGSTAFMAERNWRKLAAYVSGLLLVCESCSHCEP